MRFETPVLLGLLIVGVVPLVTAVHAPTEVRVVLENHQFHPAEIRVQSGMPFVLITANRDSDAEEFECETLRIERDIARGKTRRGQFTTACGPEGIRSTGEKHATAKEQLVVD
jgi:hypothetical protein